MKKLRYFSTFTGIGGLDWGLEKRGAKCVGFSEIRQTSIDIYKSHYPGHECLGDITKLDLAALPDFDVFTGGFPCQSFSLAGLRKGFKDRRGQMIFYIYDILMAKQPEFAVLENVKGITTHDGGKTYRNIFKLLWSAGYHVRVVMLNSSHYGSAQGRERVLFLCRRGQDFALKNPEKRDDKKRFRDIRCDDEATFDFLPPNKAAGVYGERTVYNDRRKLKERDLWPFEIVGGYDRVGTILTAKYGDARRPKITQTPEGRWRYLSLIEAERLQNFPDGWTEGVRADHRWFALGNAVNCNVSDYLFNDYLEGLWW
jgi:DNA (cytosine-5)-methyltransferase 1